MQVDHIFIFTNDNGKVADELVQFGLTEGSSRVHIGQGTTNRKFYFENFFLEILWVHNEEELKSDKTKPTGLWQRADFNSNNSPFGLCIVNTDEIENLFKNSFKYQPEYFPIGLNIDIIKNEQNLNLPWTFRLPFKGQKKNETEPIEHKYGLKKLTSIEFGVSNFDKADEFIQQFSGQKNITFSLSSTNNLTLTFDENKNGQTKEFEKINLKIKY
ncbi:VOC family protein [Ferruginibacter yonginensis]|uniref:VOC family protein n=1 Tax=Ferruginibacter yonginensis TaxID=1310416 RepID=A0ABV8QXQ6_9BACT